jgi:hypothetical protein
MKVDMTQNITGTDMTVSPHGTAWYCMVLLKKGVEMTLLLLRRY